MSKLNRLVPSPAMVVACTALFIALGGSAYALGTGVIDGREIKNYSITGKDIKKDGIGGVTIKESRLGTVPSASGLAQSATVTAAGAGVRGKGVLSAQRVGTGRYQVRFARNVQSCVAVASVGDPSAAGPPNGSASTSLLPTDGNVIQVRTEDGANGAAENRGFNLIVSC